ncbi:uncharacterized protein TRIADDRAFT_59671 [Trichoplax adhaerens]|uniref:Uncharacterized protein n=1 Tax=Trichoplax adhaerens TaxID=10228 RepID=B3S645_TRIAD|nr:hypothetical protein TRIADDRAFT_59671 [Trichoplax adhaerens]EDV21695.1 hypothetical protein TRIADDRAFT_59671 [Trichoplax adhaerens]|eukprot:XP_002115843.1 hypothetical protein TRIADDRAFT_59671 [Trichoplax adhaerens]
MSSIQQWNGSMYCCARLYNNDTIEEFGICTNKHSCGFMNKQCRYCKALMSIEERFGGALNQPKFDLCCLSGKIAIQEVPDPLDELRRLLTDMDTVSKYFRANIRKFNCGLCMASMKANDVNIAGGASTYRIQGLIYRILGPA